MMTTPTNVRPSSSILPAALRQRLSLSVPISQLRRRRLRHRSDLATSPNKCAGLLGSFCLPPASEDPQCTLPGRGRAHSVLWVFSRPFAPHPQYRTKTPIGAQPWLPEPYVSEGTSKLVLPTSGSSYNTRTLPVDHKIYRFPPTCYLQGLSKVGRGILIVFH